MARVRTNALTRAHYGLLKALLMAYKGIATDGHSVALLDRFNRIVYLDIGLVRALDLHKALPKNKAFSINEVIRQYESSCNGKRGNSNRATK